MTGKFAKDESVVLSLVSDCVNFGLDEKQSLLYIKTRFGKDMSPRTYYKYKKKIDSGQYAEQWLSYFAKVGFLINHKQYIETIETIQKDTMKDYLVLNTQDTRSKNMKVINTLRNDIRENTKLLQELSLGTPIIAQIKAKLENAQMLSVSP